MGLKTMITGATGTLGRELVPLLKAQELDVVVASRFLEKLPEGVRGIQLPFENVTLLEQAFRDVEVLVFIQPLGEVMLQQARNVTKAARAAGVEFVLKVSGLGASPVSPYLYQRVQGEADEMLIQSGLRYCILRPSPFMQCYLNRYRDSLVLGAIYLPEGEGRTSFIDARDVAEVVAQILKDPFRYHRKVLSLTGERALSNAEAISIISHHVSRRLAYVPVTEDLALTAMQKMGEEAWMCEALLSQHRATRDGRNAEITHTVKTILGRDPRSFESFCERSREAWVIPPPSPEP